MKMAASSQDANEIVVTFDLLDTFLEETDFNGDITQQDIEQINAIADNLQHADPQIKTKTMKHHFQMMI